MGMKEGPNREDQNRIKEWAAEGKNADQISGLLQIKVEGVRIFLDSLAPPELSPQQRAANTRAANKAAAAANEPEEDED